jgi:hypothetical protein
MGKYLREWRKKHARLVKGWRKILESERAQTSQIEYLGRKLSEMGERGIKDKRLQFGGKRKGSSSQVCRRWLAIPREATLIKERGLILTEII